MPYPADGPHPDPRGPTPAWQHRDRRRQKRRAASDGLRPVDRRAPDPGQRAAPGRHRHHGRVAGPARHRSNRPGPLPRAGRPDHQHRSPLRHRPQNARLGAGARRPAGPLRRGAGLAARRLRHRHPPRRSAPQRPGADGRGDRPGRRLHLRLGDRPPARRPHHADHAVGRRHREPANGQRPGGRPDGNRQCRPRARDFRPRPLPERHGRPHRGRRHRAPGDRRRRAPARRASRDTARPHRDRHLCLRRRHHRRRRAAGRRAPHRSRRSRRRARARRGGGR